MQPPGGDPPRTAMPLDGKKVKPSRRAVRSNKLDEESALQELARRVADEAPAHASVACPAREFVQLPLSDSTLAGLSKAGFSHMTEIQRTSIPHALAGAAGSDRRYPGGSNGPSGDRYRLGHRPVMDLGLWLNVQSGHSKLATSVGPGELCRCDRVWAEKARPGSSGPCKGSSRAGKLGLWMHLQLGVARKAPTRRYL